MEVTCNAQVVEQKWAARHEKEGQAVHDMLLDLSGLYVKSAQILASKQDFMPEPWCRRLAAMFDSMPPKPWAHVARVCLILLTSGCLFCKVCVPVPRFAAWKIRTWRVHWLLGSADLQRAWLFSYIAHGLQSRKLLHL